MILGSDVRPSKKDIFTENVTIILRTFEVKLNNHLKWQTRYFSTFNVADVRSQAIILHEYSYFRRTTTEEEKTVYSGSGIFHIRKKSFY